MSPEFSAAVDPIITYMLSVMDDIEFGKVLLAEDVASRVRSFIDQAEQRLGQRDDWELSKYALVALVDDLLMDAPWEGRRWWEQNRLEFEYFRSADAFTLFYVKAKEAAKIPKKDALEVFYVCVVLGFHGIYGDANAVAHTDEFGLPATLEEWVRRTSMSIQLGQGRPTLLERGRPGPGAPPLEGKYLLIGSSLSFLLLLAITIFATQQIFGS
jgi:type VI secretion system protein ImpK